MRFFSGVMQMFNLASSQQAIWIDQQLSDAGIYSVGAIARFRSIDEGRLLEALSKAYELHDSLHLRFRFVRDIPVQYVAPCSPCPIKLVDLSSEPCPETAARNHIEEEFNNPIRLHAERLCEFVILRVRTGQVIWLTKFHHLTCDGRGWYHLLNDVSELYREPQRILTRPRWHEIVESEARFLESADGETDRQLWHAESACAPEELFPLSRGGSGRRVQRTIPLSVAWLTTWKNLARECKSTRFQILFSLLAHGLQGLFDQKEVCIGVACENRGLPLAQHAVGEFAKVLPVRCTVQSEPLPGFLRRVAHQIAEVVRHAKGAYPASAGGTLRIKPQVMLNYVQSRSELPFGGLLEEACVSRPGGGGPVQLSVVETANDGARLVFSMDERLQDDPRIALLPERLIASLLSMARVVAGAPHRDLEKVFLTNVDFLLPDEAERLLAWGSERSCGFEGTLLSHFEESVRMFPAAPAVSMHETTLSYETLNQLANRCARSLLSAGVRSGHVVALCLDRSLELAVAQVAVLKAGAAYLPIGTDIPPERLDFILSQAQVNLMVCKQESTYEKYLSIQVDTSLEALVDQRTNVSDWERHGQVEGSSPAYVIFTSGSTGAPKGVLISHAAALTCVLDEQIRPDQARAPVLMLSAPCFDASVIDFWPALLAGASVAIAPAEMITPYELRDLIARHKPESCFFPTPLFHELVNADVQCMCGLDQVLVGGDSLGRESVVKFFEAFPHARLGNGYGPTEVAVVSTIKWLHAGAEIPRQIPIGSPLSRRSMFVLNPDLCLVPTGAEGDLYIGGPGLAIGYIHDADLTANSFRLWKDPLGNEHRLYRTGDRALWNEAGELVFRGRKDGQVKIRGYRVEMGEIEDALLHAGATDAVVVTVGAGGACRLFAFAVPSKDKAHLLSSASFNRALAHRLPPYMRPADTVLLDRIPLTPNGKIDRRALTARAADMGTVSAGARRKPKDRTEGVLYRCFTELTQACQVDAHDNFFDIGGTSLTAIRLSANIRSEFGIEISVRTIYENPTPELLAIWIDSNRLSVSYDPLVCLRRGGKPAEPLFLVHPASGSAFSYWNLLNELQWDGPVYGLQARGEAAGENPMSLSEMLFSYEQAIRSKCGRGRVHLLGWSFGGWLAHGLACRLSADLLVGNLIVLDSATTSQNGNQNIDKTLSKDRVSDWLGMTSEIAIGGPNAHLVDAYQKLSERVNSIVENNVKVMQCGPLGVYGGSMLFVEGDDGFENHANWRPFVTGDLRVVRVACGHHEMMKPAHVPKIGALVTAAMEQHDELIAC